MTEDAKNPGVDENSHADEKGRAEDQPKTQTESVTQTDAADASTDTLANAGEAKEAEVVSESDSTKTSSDEDKNKSSAENISAENTEEKSENTKSTEAEKTSSTDASAEDKKLSDKSSSDSTEKSDDTKSANHHKHSTDFQEQVREQIENCKFEIISSVQESIHTELVDSTRQQIRKVERRRRAGYIIRDILILLLAAVVGYFGYCLYDVKYFDFLRPECEQNNTCPISQPEDQNPEEVKEPEVIKDTAWYRQNYGYLFDNLQIGLNADKVEAYYLYSGDYKASDIQSNFLLGMAYNHLNSTVSYDTADGIIVPAADLRTAYISLLGNADNFTKRNFTYHCAEFQYDKNSDSFSAASVLCADQANRTILESVDEIYEEGNALYFLTTATIYDRAEQSFYTFDNLFKPAVANVAAEDLPKHASLLNHYQYQFKKTGDKYYFSGIIKLN